MEKDKSEDSGRGGEGSWNRKHTEGSSDDDLAELDAEDEDVVEWVVLGVETITFADLGVRGMSCAPIAVVLDDEGMMNFSGRK